MRATGPGPSEREAPRELVRTTTTGRLRLVWYGAGEPTGVAFEALVEAGLARLGQRDAGSRCTAAGQDAWVKGGRLTPKSTLRHQLRWLALRRPFPRLQEAANLTWLRAHGIPAARPLLAGLHASGHLPDAQFLATEFLADTVPLDELRRTDPTRHERARAAARAIVHNMHAAHFEHRDCYERNFLITRTNEAIAIDTWRGGPRRRLGSRAAVRDLRDFEQRPEPSA